MNGSIDAIKYYYNSLQTIFPNLYTNNSNSIARFYISMELNAFDRTLSPYDEIMIVFRYNCDCYNKYKQPRTDIMLLKKAFHKSKITIKDAIDGMINVGYIAKCRHCYLEGFEQKTMNEFVAMFHS